MPIDFTKPVKTDNYDTGMLSSIRAHVIALACMLEPTAAGTLTSTPTGARRINNANGLFEFFNGTSWAEQVVAYAKFDNGFHQAALGTAALPSYTFTGDTNTGTYSPGADQWAVATGGVQRAVIGASGNVTINAPSSGSTLTLTALAAASLGGFRLCDSASSTGVFRIGGTGVSDWMHLGLSSTEGYAYVAANLPYVIYTNTIVRVIVSGAGAVLFPSISTTASAANAFLDSANSNNLLRSTSSIRYKTNVRDLPAKRAANVLALRPVLYNSLAEADDKSLDWFGLIAEEVAEVEPRLVQYTQLETDGPLVPDGVQYERIVVLLLAQVKELTARVAALEDARMSHT